MSGESLWAALGAFCPRVHRMQLWGSGERTLWGSPGFTVSFSVPVYSLCLSWCVDVGDTEADPHHAPCPHSPPSACQHLPWGRPSPLLPSRGPSACEQRGRWRRLATGETGAGGGLFVTAPGARHGRPCGVDRAEGAFTRGSRIRHHTGQRSERKNCTKYKAGFQRRGSFIKGKFRCYFFKQKNVEASRGLVGEGVPAEDTAGAVQVLVAEKPGCRVLGITWRHAPGFAAQPTRVGGERPAHGRRAIAAAAWPLPASRGFCSDGEVAGAAECG